MLSMNYVYVVGNGRDGVKVGKSTRPEGRVEDLATASPFPLITYYVGATNGDGGAIERVAHRILWGQRMRREWFAVPPATAISAIETAAATLGLPLMRVDKGLMLADGQLPAQSAPFVHRLNMRVLRGLAGALLLAAIATIGVFVAVAAQFLFFSR